MQSSAKCASGVFLYAGSSLEHSSETACTELIFLFGFKHLYNVFVARSVLMGTVVH